jgi:NAD(P)-dependent dehydrogenase (short-subunit alcohol dehydrogenase family)
MSPPYSKWALEAFSEALSKELDASWNIKIILLQIGSFATNAIPLALQTAIPIHPAYAQLPPDSTVRAVRAYFATEFVDGQPGDPIKAGREIYNIGLDNTIETLRIPFGQDSLADAEKRVDDIKESIEQTAKFSADLKLSA